MGTFLNLTFLSIFENIVQRRLKFFPNILFGEYGDPPLLSKWIPQLAIWLVFVVMGKCIILFFMLNLITRIDAVIKYAFQIFSHQPELELVMVMIVIPTILNSIQFWVTDSFLKGQGDSDDREGAEDSYPNLDEELIPNVSPLLFHSAFLACILYFFSHNIDQIFFPLQYFMNLFYLIIKYPFF